MGHVTRWERRSLLSLPLLVLPPVVVLGQPLANAGVGGGPGREATWPLGGLLPLLAPVGLMPASPASASARAWPTSGTRTECCAGSTHTVIPRCNSLQRRQEEEGTPR